MNNQKAENKRYKIALFMILLFVGMFVISIKGQNVKAKTIDYPEIPVWNGTIDTMFEGSGTKNDPYLITNAEELAGLASNVNGGNNYYEKYFLLTSDIVLNDISNVENWETNAPSNSWTAIGNNTNVFSGNFDGANHTISGVYINKTGSTNEDFYQGLFGYLQNANINNIGVINSYIKGYSSIGGVIGYSNGGTVDNCYNTGSVISTSGTVGGIAGSSRCPITNCYNTGTISGFNNYVGGIVGYNQDNIIDCYNTGSIIGNTGYVGGVTGYNASTIWNCYNTGIITGTLDNVGGVVGANGTSIRNCYNTGSVFGRKNVGGVAGSINDNHAITTGSYNIGLVSGESNVGGVAGYKEDLSTVANCYYLESCATDENNTIQFGIGNDTIGQITTDTSGITVAFSKGGGSFDHDLDESVTTSNITLLEALNIGATIYNDTNPRIKARLWVDDDVNMLTNDGYPVFAFTAVEFGLNWCDEGNLPNNISKSNITEIKFLLYAPILGYINSNVTYNNIKIYQGIGGEGNPKTTDIIYVYRGPIVAESNCANIFANCNALTSIDFNNFNTSEVTDMKRMFNGCSNLTSIDLSSFNTSKVEDMTEMFSECSSLISIDLSNFNMEKITATSGITSGVDSMLKGCNNLAMIIAPYGLKADSSVNVELPGNYVLQNSTDIVTVITKDNCSTISGTPAIVNAKKYYRQYTITYYDQAESDLIDYTGSACTTNYIYGIGYNLPIPTRTNYSFNGWFTTHNGTTEVNEIASTDTGNKTLYAKWEPNKFNIIYKDKGNEDFTGIHGINFPQQHTYSIKTILVVPTRIGYVFAGWFITPDCTGTAITELSATSYTENITLYANWTTCTHTYNNDCDIDCNVCGQTRSITHNYSEEWSTDSVNHWHECSVCGVKSNEAAHNNPEEWSTDATNHWHECSVCGVKNDEAAHNYIDATCTAPKTCSICGLTEGSALGHTIVIDEAVPATCTETGLTEGSHCSVCNTIIIAQTSINALGHSFSTEYTVDTQPTDGSLETMSRHCTHSGCDVIIDVTTKDEENKISVTNQNGFESNVKIEIKVVAIDKIVEQTQNALSEIITKSEKVVAMYDIKLLTNGIESQPDGMLTIRFIIPEECINKEFKLIHVHGTKVVEMEYTLDGNYVMVNTDKLSEFVFVTNNTGSIVWLIILLTVIVLVEIALAVVKLYKNKNSKKTIKTYSFSLLSLAVFIPVGQIVITIVLGILCIVGGVYDVYLYFFKDQVDKQKEKQEDEEVTNL